MMVREMFVGAMALVLAGCVTRAAEVAAPAIPPTPRPDLSPAPELPSVPPPSVLPAPRPVALKELKLVRSSLAEAPRSMTVEEAEIPSTPTKILDAEMAERLFRNTGITLQWIGWEKRGRTWVAVDDKGYWLLMAEHKGPSGGILDIEGFITEIGSDYFIYDGTIKILGTPDNERLCNMSKRGWRFGITENRKYWRLREFGWCDRLTDYIDVYF